MAKRFCGCVASADNKRQERCRLRPLEAHDGHQASANDRVGYNLQVEGAHGPYVILCTCLRCDSHMAALPRTDAYGGP